MPEYIGDPKADEEIEAILREGFGKPIEKIDVKDQEGKEQEEKVAWKNPGPPVANWNPGLTFHRRQAKVLKFEQQSLRAFFFAVYVYYFVNISTGQAEYGE